MLRNRSIALTKKQALMADQSPSFSPNKKPTTPISSFLGSPRFFNGFLSKKVHHDTEIMTPTSILDTKSTSCFVNPFAYDTKIPIPSPENNKLEPQSIGLALIDSLVEKNDVHVSKSINRMMVLGTKLKVQIPTVVNQTSPVESPRCKGDYGIRTRNSQISSSPLTTNNTPAKEFNRQLSLKEMELSEDYTCVITHGPNPKTTHIYDGCIVESCSEDDDVMFDDDDDDDDDSNTMDFEPNFFPNSPVDFLSFCYNCKERLDQGKDIFIYRGEKAFCSQECRGKEMLFDMENP